MIFVLTAMGTLFCILGIILYTNTKDSDLSDTATVLFMGSCGFIVFPFINIFIGGALVLYMVGWDAKQIK